MNDFKKETLQNSLIINTMSGNELHEQAEDIDNLVNILDSFASSSISRLKLKVSDQTPRGAIDKEYHHGRCDINSPWAKGESFDVLE